MKEQQAPRKYYLHDGDQQTGPFLLEALAQTSLTASTMVWYNGLDDWQEAASIEELRPLVQPIAPPPSIAGEVLPPPFKGPRKAAPSVGAPVFRQEKSTTAMPAQGQDDTPRGTRVSSSGFLKYAVVFILLAILGTAVYTVQQYRSTRIATDSTALAPTYEEQVLSIEDQEKAAPRKFLKASGSYKEMVFTGKFKIDGTITNSATVAKYKNVVIEVSFYTSKNKYISSERYTIEDSFPAGSTKEFKLKIDPPKGADNCKWKVVGATAY